MSVRVQISNRIVFIGAYTCFKMISFHLKNDDISLIRSVLFKPYYFQDYKDRFMNDDTANV